MYEIKPDLAKLKRICTENDRKVEELIEQYANILAHYFVESIEKAHMDGRIALVMTVDDLLKEASTRGGHGHIILRMANFSGVHPLAERALKRVLSIILPAMDGTRYGVCLRTSRSTISGICTPEIAWERRT